MTTDYRALCAELVETLSKYQEMLEETYHPDQPEAKEMDAGFRVLERARPSLAQPEPVGPSMPAAITDMPEHQQRWYALGWRAALARYGRPASQPEPVGATDEELLATQNQAVASFPPVHPEAEPLSAVEYARELRIRKARAVLARYARPAITPIPVSERLPGAEDCAPEGSDAVGCCWLWEPDINGHDPLGAWKLEHRDWASDGDYTYWLPFHALPLPPTT